MMVTSEDTNKLKERIMRNRENQSFSLEEWIFSDMDIRGFRRILELCSGTGHQSNHIVSLANPEASITLSDISSDACNILKKKFDKNKNVKILNKGIDDLLDSINDTFDFVFVSYGLYYSRHIEHVLCGKIEKLLTPSGRFVVVGPHVGNNYELFEFLSSLGITIPGPVTYCCEAFMQNILQEMIPFSSQVKLKFFDNIQKWTSAKSLFSYWQNTTFYNAEKDEMVKSNLKLYFERNKDFQVTKKISLFDFIKKG